MNRRPLVIRWLMRHDLPKVVMIDQESNQPAWCNKRFLKSLQCRKTVGYVIVQEDIVTGYMLLKYHRERSYHISIERMAIAVGERFQGHGTMLLQMLKIKSNVRPRRFPVRIDLWERNEGAILFFFRNGFRTDGMIRHGFGEDDGLRMVFEIPKVAGVKK